jgi:Flp pilus assembly protein TadB
MDGPRLLLAVAALATAGVCLLLLAAPDLQLAVRRLRPSVVRLLAAEGTALALAQAELRWMPVPLWVGLRIGLSVILAALAGVWFGLAVLGLVCGVVIYQALGMALEVRRRRAEARRQSALLEAIRYGGAVMARSGNAGQMIEALAESGPFQARRIFKEIVDARDEATSGLGLAPAIERMRSQIADPVFDDLALALSLHWRQGGRLVPALEVLVADWAQTLSLQREAKAMRAGVEASVLLLALLPFLFLVTLQLLAPALLAPLRSSFGEVLFGFAVAWMVAGYRLLQRISQPPREDRIRLRESIA